MSCNKCKKSKCNCSSVPNCGCDTPCNQPITCGCPNIVNAECVVMNDDLECAGIDRGKRLNVVLKEMDEYLCELLEIILSQGSIIITNVGDGAEVFKGVSATGIREFRTLKSDSLDITQGENTISIEYEPCIESETLSVTEGEDGCISIENCIQSDTLQIDIDENKCHNIDVCIESDTLQIDIDENKCYNIDVCIESDTLNVTQEDGCIQINLADLDLPRFIVNNLYTGVEQLGTQSKPFKTIQNAVNAFIGTGTANNPQFAGGVIIVQRGNTYGFTGNWSIRDITIVVEEGAIINHTPSSGMYLVDYDSLTEDAANFELNIREGAQINLNERGFRNRGSSGGSATPKTIAIRGGGTINMGGTYSSGYYIIESNTTNIDGYLITPAQQFEIEGVELRSAQRGIYNIGRNSNIRISNSTLRTGNTTTNVDATLQAFRQSGGAVSLSFCEILIAGVTRNNAFYFTRGSDNAWSSVFYMFNCKLVFPQEISNALFYNLSHGTTDVSVYGLTREGGSTTTYKIFDSPNVLWGTIDITFSDLNKGYIPANIDLTQTNTRSVTNRFNGQVSNILVKFGNRADAVSAGLVSGDTFLNTNGGDVDPDTHFIDIIP